MSYQQPHIQKAASFRSVWPERKLDLWFNDWKSRVSQRHEVQSEHPEKNRSGHKKFNKKAQKHPR